ncbi:NADH dehydrogenase subunit C [Pseudopedobacter saltans DSM 12145]|uniref:NADH-quinone oxidoreductase subunit C n=1 Tax=Pseudopedobacter saltans (strain ATCC 51119 / DSM 12145 / JCM 21818 / CCUG 39354 / LMG 10337 / NBRC 100064 / NCIMB 13643) TaxID=762903 RepID=F0SEM6_PSESL|nr:NADH-quinone oxidoreductase subunit C [Pseudopedobacter saltans]ADY51916.1 NADH dehydrogenase subunit C [Pseudopedobacter saltans DSM 12145]
MTFQEIKQLIVENIGKNVIVGEETTGLQPALIINPDYITEVCLELRDNKNTWFDFLSSLSGVDYGVESGKFGVVYHLSSIIKKHQLVLKVFRENDRNEQNLPVFKSVSSIWRTAEWHERETFDLFGIFFESHPDLRRILLPDDWKGYPLRKDYKNAETYKNIKIDL